MVAHLSGVNWANLDLPEFLKLEHFEMAYSEEGGHLSQIFAEVSSLVSNARNIVENLNFSLSFLSPPERE